MTITREQGYAIEGGPEPKPAEDSPERLRERREALGLERGDSIFARASIYEGNIAHVEECTGFDPAGRSLDCCPNTRRCYAAALSAEEERRGAQLLADEEARAEAFHAEPDHLAYADSPVWDDGPLPTPTPERPAPRFKEGDWVRHRESAGAWQVASFFEDSRGYVYCWNSHHSGFPEDVIVAAEVPGEPVPASPPAPEVVDVPQPIVKRCACSDIHDAVEAEWQPGEPYLTVTHTTVPLALLRAMLEAIDAQQGGAS